MSVALPAGIILDAASPLYRSLAGLADDARLAFFAGLPGTGKSLLIHQLAHLAHARGRTIHLLQWDTARPVFERSEAGRPYPQLDGVTHGIIRVAAGRWARDAVGRWHRDHPGAEHLMIGETPFVGHRFVELARQGEDAAEAALGGPTSRFIIPVPSPAVRRHLERERDHRTRQPLHEREREDAPPHVLHDLWRQIALVGRALGVTDAASGAAAVYTPDVYTRVYLHVLARRHVEVMAVDEVLPTTSFSAYAFDVPCRDVLPGHDDTRMWIRAAEEAFPDPATLQKEIERWYESP